MIAIDSAIGPLLATSTISPLDALAMHACSVVLQGDGPGQIQIVVPAVASEQPSIKSVSGTEDRNHRGSGDMT
ncbi:MAG: hypothetical protein ABIR10_12250 [Dokdonella sp.]